MDSKYLFAVAAFLLVGNCQATADESQTAPNINKYLEDAKKSLTNIASTLGLPSTGPETDPAKIQQNIADQTQKFVDQLKGAISKFQTDVNAKDGAIPSLIAQINETTSNLITPELQQKTKHFHETVSQSLNQIGEHLGKITTEINKEAQPNGSLHQVGADFLKKFTEVVDNYKNSFQNTAQTEPGKH